MAGGTVPAGQTSWNGTLVANTADTVQFADRYNYVVVANTSATGEIYVTSDGSVPSTAAGAGTDVAIGPGQSLVIGNGLAYWNQSATVIKAGTAQIPTGGGYSVPTSPTVGTAPGTPGEVQPFGSSLAGKSANPGTTIKIISATANTYTVSANG